MIYESINIPLWRALRACRNLKVLDVGCGTGALGEKLVAGGNTVVGITHSNAEAAIAENRITSVYTMDLNDLAAVASLTGTFDIILFADVLEHLLNPADVLRALLPRLAPGGRVFVSLPNIACFYTRFGLLFGQFTMSDSGGILDDTHLHFYTRKTAKALLTSVQLDVVRTDFIPAPSVWFYQTFLKKPATNSTYRMADMRSFQIYESRIYPIERFFTAWWTTMFANQFVFHCRLRT